MINKDEQNSKQCLKKTLKSDLKPWIPAVSSLEALAKSIQYLQNKTEEE